MAKASRSTRPERPAGAFAATLRRLTDLGPAGGTAGTAPEFGPGDLVDRRYRIVEKLGEGGMGAVFKVEHVRMGKLMALKLLLRDIARDRTFVTRFEQEAQIASRLSCPNTVSVFDFGEMPGHGLYMAMEYVPGRDLGTLLDADGPLAERNVIGIGVQVLQSLAEAHDAGIVHRDIKPPNVMLLRTREAKDFVKVLDFGIAKLAGPGRRADASLFGQDLFVGTPEYASPEQIRGAEVDARSDLYSLAAMLYELLVGRPPFVHASAVGVVEQHLSTPPPRFEDVAPSVPVSERLEAILRRALAKDPAERYRSADQMRGELESIAERYSGKIVLGPVRNLSEAVQVDEAIAQRTDWDAFERAIQRSERNRRIAGTLLALGILGGGAVGVISLVRHTTAEPTPLAAFDEEVEPNHDPARANLIHPGRELAGRIGPRLSDGESDVDCFQFEVPGPTPAHATVRVTDVPNVNVALELFAEKAGPAPSDGGRPQVVWRALARVDDQPLHARAPELLTDLVLAPGRYLIKVRDRRRPSEREVIRPRENSTDPYQLLVTLGPVDAFGEVEPNDTVEDQAGNPAATLPSSQPVRGHSGRFAPRDTSADVGAVLSTDDRYLFRLSQGADTACALLLGTRHAELGLTLAPEGRGAGVHGTVRGRELLSRCTAASGAARVHLALEEGGDEEERYLLAVIDDGQAGFEGALKAATLLEEEGRKDEAERLLSRAVAELPRAPGAAQARARQR